MKRSAVLILALVALVGCGTTRHVLNAGQQHAYSSSFPPLKLASCTAYNASSFSRHYIGEVEQLIRPGNYQVVVTQISRLRWHYQPIIVAHASPAPSGSQLVVFTSHELAPDIAADWIERLRRGCDIETRPAVVVPMPPSGVLPAEIPPAPRPLPASPLPQRRGTRG